MLAAPVPAKPSCMYFNAGKGRDLCVWLRLAPVELGQAQLPGASRPHRGWDRSGPTAHFRFTLITALRALVLLLAVTHPKL
jgi:hypothetical protein